MIRWRGQVAERQEGLVRREWYEMTSESMIMAKAGGE